MFGKKLQDVNLSDLQSLKDNEIAESKELDYKASINLSAGDEKKELCKDVSAMANTSGGYIIIGVNEKKDENGRNTGLPETIDGFCDNPDDMILRIINILRDNISPRINGLQIQPVKVNEQGYAIIIQIPKSFNAPHMTVKQSTHFYIRSSTSSNPMDIGEIRSAFALSESLSEKIRRFRNDRIMLINSGDTPVPLRPGAKIVLHLISTNILSSQYIDIKKASSIRFRPLATTSCFSVFNLNGFVVKRNLPGDKSTYLQVFRDGAIESVLVQNADKLIRITTIESEIIERVGQYLQNFNQLEVPLPIFIMLSFVNSKDYYLYLGDPRLNGIEFVPFDRDILLFPDIMIESYDVDVPKALKPMFDMVWQSAGVERCLNYDQDGNYTPSRGN